jgi:hypothetical protein
MFAVKSGELLGLLRTARWSRVWPYRPREGYPVVPRWLFFLILLTVVAVYVAVLSFVGHDPTDIPPSG